MSFFKQLSEQLHSTFSECARYMTCVNLLIIVYIFFNTVFGPPGFNWCFSFAPELVSYLSIVGQLFQSASPRF